MEKKKTNSSHLLIQLACLLLETALQLSSIFSTHQSLKDNLLVRQPLLFCDIGCHLLSKHQSHLWTFLPPLRQGTGDLCASLFLGLTARGDETTRDALEKLAGEFAVSYVGL
jgi:pyridoxal/pyridoxine/pyridoxamine kinase